MGRARTVGMGLLFYPRGGSAQVARYLADALLGHGWTARLVTGSLGDPGAASHAPTFFGRPDLTTVDYDDGAERFASGEDPLAGPVPFHPSYEDRPDVPDRVFGRVDDAAADRLVASWIERLASWEEAEVLHLHHLTPIHHAAEARFPEVPRITHLHGTELKFVLEAARRSPDDWPHAAPWVDRMTDAALGSAHVLCISDHDRDLAIELLGLSADRITIVPNGVDIERFRPRSISPGERRDRWTRWLVDEPLGWAEDGAPGSVAATDADLDRHFGPVDDPRPVLLFVGRFLRFKRVDLLVRAYARARADRGLDAPLVIWGGSPGEWEGDHPHTVASQLGVEGVFFVGWRGHDELALGLACSDVLTAPSVDEPFGQVYLEAMACGLPVIGTATGGPLGFVDTRPDTADGWLVAPDDELALARALADAAGDHDERRRRGANALAHARADFAWSSLAGLFADLYADVAGR